MGCSQEEEALGWPTSPITPCGNCEASSSDESVGYEGSLSDMDKLTSRSTALIPEKFGNLLGTGLIPAVLLGVLGSSSSDMVRHSVVGKTY
jgi:hypothetical protein